MDPVVDAMEKTVGSTKKTVFFMDPSCTALNRIWCLYEIYQTKKTGKKAEDLEILSGTDSIINLRTVIQSIDSSRATASNEWDRAKILDLIKKGPGTTEIDKMIKESLLLSIEHELERATELSDNALIAHANLKAAVMHWTTPSSV
jgi:hypothetical protein